MITEFNKMFNAKQITIIMEYIALKKRIYLHFHTASNRILLHLAFAMYHKTIELALKFMAASGNTPEKGYSVFQVSLFLGNILSGFSVIFLVIMKLALQEEPLSIANSKEDIAGAFLFVQGILKASAIFINKSKVAALLVEMKRFSTIEDFESERYKREFRQEYKVIRNTFIFTVVLHCFTAGGFLIPPIFAKGNLLPFDCYIPSWLGYYSILTYQQFVSMNTIMLPVLAMDYFFMTTVRMTRIQFKVLNERVRNIFDDDQTIGAGIDVNIKECVKNHNFLLRYAHMINDTFSIFLLHLLGIEVLLMSFEIYIIMIDSDLETLRDGLIYIAATCTDFMLCFCYPSQALMDEIAEIANSAYNSKWYEHPKYAGDIRFIIQRGQKSVLIEAGKFSPMDVRTGLATIQTMVSYAMFLKTMGGDAN